MNIDHFQINKKIHARFQYFWPQRQCNFPHEDNLKLGLVEYFLENGIVSFPEFSIPYGRCDLLGLDKEEKCANICEFKHSYDKNINGVISDLERLFSLRIEEIIQERTSLIINNKRKIFICGMMSKMHFVYDSIVNKEYKSEAELYLKNCNIIDYEIKLNKLTELLTIPSSSISIINNKINNIEYWIMIWSM